MDRKDPHAPQARYNGLSWADFTTLATYNAECGRGVVHTRDWDMRMTRLQERFGKGEAQRRGAYDMAPGQ